VQMQGSCSAAAASASRCGGRESLSQCNWQAYYLVKAPAVSGAAVISPRVRRKGADTARFARPRSQMCRPAPQQANELVCCPKVSVWRTAAHMVHGGTYRARSIQAYVQAGPFHDTLQRLTHKGEQLKRKRILVDMQGGHVDCSRFIAAAPARWAT